MAGSRAPALPPAALIATALATMLLVSEVEGRPAIRSAFFNAYPSAVGTRLDNLPSNGGHCGVCHLDFNGGGTRNPYGNRVRDVYKSFPTIEQALHSIEGEDPDGDGFSALTEITDTINYSNTPTFPGLNTTNAAGVLNVNLAEIVSHLTPTSTVDNMPPTVTVLAPNGAESWVGGSAHTVSWTATDNVAVVGVDVFYRDHESEPWKPIARSLPNTGMTTWFVLNTPTTDARVRVVAYDGAGNSGADMSNALFTITRQPGGIVPTTLRDFEQPGTQPLDAGVFEAHSNCMPCHGNYDSAVEPGHNWRGSMMAQAGRDPLFFACLAVAEQDAPSSGDLCLRCHSPFGWLSGKSTPTGGSQLSTAADFDGVACDLCHRMVDPIYNPGVSPIEDLTLLASMLPAHVPTSLANGQFVVDSNARKRGPFVAVGAGHSTLVSPFHQEGDFCGTCHDVSNPVFERTAGADYAPGPLDQKAALIASDVLMPLERTYSEWLNSSYPAGVYAPEFAGNKVGGIVATCQDCHMRDVSGAGCSEVGSPIRADLPLHDMTGGSSWMPGVINSLYPGETNAAASAAAAARAVSILQKSAVLGLGYTAEAGSLTVSVTVTNRTGHKLPTGYPEGRRMWIHLVARDIDNSVVFESGAYDAATGVLSMTPMPRVYEAHLGISPGLGAALMLPHGESFHFTLNDSIYKDNRIPPLGFTNTAFEAFGGAPVDPYHPGPGPRYEDGQNWDTAVYRVPGTPVKIVAELYYQSTSKDYIEFLRDENTTNSAGLDLYNIWVANGRSAPVLMEADSLTVTGVSVAQNAIKPTALRMLRNPFERELPFRLDVGTPTRVTLDVFDVAGRRIANRDYGVLGGGPHRLTWDGRDDRGRPAGGGIYWARIRAGEKVWTEQVVRIK